MRKRGKKISGGEAERRRELLGESIAKREVGVEKSLGIWKVTVNGISSICEDYFL